MNPHWPGHFLLGAEAADQPRVGVGDHGYRQGEMREIHQDGGEQGSFGAADYLEIESSGTEIE